MARIAIEAALGSGFGLIRRRPGAVLLWGLVYLALSAASFGLFGSYYLSLFTHFAAAARSGADMSPQAMNAMAPQIMAMQGLSWLMSLISLVVTTVLYCAVFRAILHPEQSRFGYLRLGAPELLLFVLGIAAYIVVFVAAIPVVLVVALLAVALIAMHAAAAGVILAVLAGVAATVVLAWLALRFSMVGPMMVADGKFRLFESWVLTRGHAGALFVIAACPFLILIVAELIIAAVLMAAGVVVLSSAAGGLANLPAFFSRPPSAVVAGMAPLLILAAVLWTPLMGCFIAVLGAPWARAYLDLTEPRPVAIAA